MRAGKKSRVPATPKGGRKPARRRAPAGRGASQTTTKATARPAKEPAGKVTRKRPRKVVVKKAISRTAVKGAASPKSPLKIAKQAVRKIVKAVLPAKTRQSASKPAKSAAARSPAVAKVKGAVAAPQASKVAPLEHPPVPPVDRSQQVGPGLHPQHRSGSGEPVETPGVHRGSAAAGSAEAAARAERGPTGGEGHFSARPEEPSAAADASGGDSEGRPPLPVPIASFTI